MPGLVEIDACFLSNPYATTEVLNRLQTLAVPQLTRMVEHYPSQASVIARALAPQIGCRAGYLCLANGACEVIPALLARSGPLLLSLPTFSAYYEFATGPVMTQRLDRRARTSGSTWTGSKRWSGGILPTPSSSSTPTTRTAGSSRMPSSSTSSSGCRQGRPDHRRRELRPLRHEAPTDVPGPAGRRLAAPDRGQQPEQESRHRGTTPRLCGDVPDRAETLQRGSLWNLNAFAEWFCGLLGDPEFQADYEACETPLRPRDPEPCSPGSTTSHHPELSERGELRPLELDRPAAEVVGVAPRPPRRLRPGLRRQTGAGRRHDSSGSRPERRRRTAPSLRGLRSVLEQPARYPLSPVIDDRKPRAHAQNAITPHSSHSADSHSADVNDQALSHSKRSAII